MKRSDNKNNVAQQDRYTTFSEETGNKNPLKSPDCWIRSLNMSELPISMQSEIWDHIS